MTAIDWDAALRTICTPPPNDVLAAARKAAMASVDVADLSAAGDVEEDE